MNFTPEPQQLLRALSVRHPQLWNHSASFRAMVTLLAELIPFMVDGIAAQAEKTDLTIQQAYQSQMALTQILEGFPLDNPPSDAVPS